jgi:hypothetical protein
MMTHMLHDCEIRLNVASCSGKMQSLKRTLPDRVRPSMMDTTNRHKADGRCIR